MCLTVVWRRREAEGTELFRFDQLQSQKQITGVLLGPRCQQGWLRLERPQGTTSRKESRA